MVKNLDDTSTGHPIFHSTETLDDGQIVPVTLFTYQRQKFILYRIASPIIGDVYFMRGATMSQITERIGKINEELLAWFKTLPLELRLSESNHKAAGEAGKIINIFKLQALALQLAYDNMQILLHRPLLSLKFPRLALSMKHPQQYTQSHESLNGSLPSLKDLSISRNQCWESALRTSNILDHLDVLRVAKNTHAASYIGIQMFTAGILLGIVALSEPLSSQAQEAKQALARVIRLSKALGHTTLLTAQSGKILEALVKIILAKEMKELLSDKNPVNDEYDRMLDTASATPDRPSSPLPEFQNSRTENSTINDTSYRDLGPEQAIYNYDDPSSLNLALGNTDFNEGLISLQEGSEIHPFLVLFHVANYCQCFGTVRSSSPSMIVVLRRPR
jgi:hypothetical protein